MNGETPTSNYVGIMTLGTLQWIDKHVLDSCCCVRGWRIDFAHHLGMLSITQKYIIRLQMKPLEFSSTLSKCLFKNRIFFDRMMKKLHTTNFCV